VISELPGTNWTGGALGSVMERAFRWWFVDDRGIAGLRPLRNRVYGVQRGHPPIRNPVPDALKWYLAL
jgi:hypothetical protein